MPLVRIGLPVVRFRASTGERDAPMERTRRIAGEGDKGGWLARGWEREEERAAEGERGGKGGGMKYPLINTPNCTDPSLQSPPGLHVHGEYSFSTLNVRLIFGRKELRGSRENEKFKRLEKSASKVKHISFFFFFFYCLALWIYV